MISCKKKRKYFTKKKNLINLKKIYQKKKLLVMRIEHFIASLLYKPELG